MSKFGTLVMGPAGAGKVCGTSAPLLRPRLTDESDYLLLSPDPTFAIEQEVMFLHQPGSCGRGICLQTGPGHQRPHLP